MSKKIIQMPFTGNPYLLTLWVRLYLERWKDEIDGVYVLINGDNMDTDVFCYCVSLLDHAKIPYIFSPIRIDHGPAIDILLSLAMANNATHIGLIEEDGFVFKSGRIADCFGLVESDNYDIVAGRRGCCSQWLIDLGKQLWDTEDHGPNFWPNFFFSSTQLLSQTDRHFGARTWQPKETVFDVKKESIKWLAPGSVGGSLAHISEISEYEQTFWSEELTVGDTFVNTSLQLRATTSPKRICLLPQYHCSPNDLSDYVAHPPYEHVFDGKAPWIHVGSLSSWYSLLMEPALAPYVEGSAPSEWERRVAFLQLFKDVADESCASMGFNLDFLSILDFEIQYGLGIKRVISEYNLDQEAINERIRIYRELMNV